ncbi:MAG: orotidine 5-phosphate decarboxylase [Pseudomonadota bacterium]
MYTIPLQFSDVIYNAANQTFEALVTVHDASGARRYACAIHAPIDMEFEDAARGLSTQAIRRHGRGDLGSILQFPPAHESGQETRAHFGSHVRPQAA